MQFLTWKLIFKNIRKPVFKTKNRISSFSINIPSCNCFLSSLETHLEILHRTSFRTIACENYPQLINSIHEFKINVLFCQFIRSASPCSGFLIYTRDVNRKLEFWFIYLFPWQLVFNLLFCHFPQGNYIKITKCQIKLMHTFVHWRVFTTVFVKWLNMAAKESIYYKI